MARIYILALVVAMAAVVALAEEGILEDGSIKVSIEKTGGSMTCTATEESKKTDDKSGETDGVTTPEPAAEPATTEAAAGGGGRKRRAAGDDDEPETTTVKVMLKSLKEVNAAGEVIGSTKTVKQEVADFSAVEFTFAAQIADSTIPNSKNKDDTAIKAVEQSYSRDLTGKGSAKITVYIAKEDGTITLGEGENTEMTDVKIGQIKFAVHIEDWDWCVAGVADGDAANCKNGETEEVGAGLDMVVWVEGKGKSVLNTAKDGMSASYDIGEKNTLYVSNMVQTTAADADDGTAGATAWAKMATDYPMKGDEGDDTTTLTMRFPWFGKSVMYESSILLTVPGSDQTSGSSAITATLAVMMLALLAAFLRL